MNPNWFKYLIISILIIPEILYGQRNITITKPRVEIFEENMIINYDILNTKPSDYYKVWIEVTDSDGNKIEPVSITGDIGTAVQGGVNKRIVWNIINDKIYIDKAIIIEVKAEKSTKEVKLKEKEERTMNLSDISKTSMILTSIPLPGLGQSLLQRGKPFWLIGITGYGCLGGSVVLNRLAASTYGDYKISEDYEERTSLYNEAVQKDKYSRYLVYSAIGLWAADLIWVIATPTKSAKSEAWKKERRLEIKPYLDANSNVTMISLTYKF